MSPSSAPPAALPHSLSRSVGATLHPPLHLLSILLLALGDWLAFGINIVTGMHAYWLVAGCCALAASAGIALVELQWNRTSTPRAAARGVATGALILLVLPLAGTVAALALFGWWVACHACDR